MVYYIDLEVKNASLSMKQTLSRDGQQIFSMDVALVCMDKAETKAVKIPSKVREAFDVYLKKGN